MELSSHGLDARQNDSWKEAGAMKNIKPQLDLIAWRLKALANSRNSLRSKAAVMPAES
jgi:hypothetical protein